ncbi:N-acetylmuramoyl-L-alanine amidase [Gordonia jinhuaensis]|uniref:N-acetylmuramoyl-L-alanine amidase n=1 Tax=Gordonia jinhuaensis TaxID=1517702 RepID=UPI00166F0078|nr:N-acetylmuramoyl-L-alanine amidase [Gordonia jinhuaensis]
MRTQRSRDEQTTLSARFSRSRLGRSRLLNTRPTRPSRESRRPSVVLGAVATLVVASPAIVLATSSTTATNVDKHAPLSSEKTRINEVSLDQVPSLVLNIVSSGLAKAGVSLPPIDLSKVHLPDIDVPVPDGLVPSQLLPQSSATQTSTTQASTTPASTTPGTPGSSTAPGRPAAAGEAVPAGAVVKEISQKTPFSMVGLTWDGIADTTAYIRARQADGSWGPWIAADPAEGSAKKTAKDPNKQGTEPIWVGKTTLVQVAVTQKGLATPAPLDSTPAPSAGATTTAVTPSSAAAPATTTHPSTTRTPAQASVPTTTVSRGGIAPRAFREEPAPAPGTSDAAGALSSAAMDAVNGAAQQIISTLQAALISPGPGGAAAPTGLAATPPGAEPPVITRAQWGADESLRCSDPTYDDSVRAAIVHHTAGTNDYTPAQSAEIVRGIYAYHAQTLGWCDIGYNALIDKYGQVFEGAFGGLDKNVEGAHTGGFNPDTVGIALLGDLDQAQPTPAMINAAGRFLGWRLKLAAIDPNAMSHLTSIGYSTAHYAAGEVTDLPVISGHRDYDSTECPGQYGYAALPQIRAIAAGGPLLTDPVLTAPQPPVAAVAGDAAAQANTPAGDAPATGAADQNLLSGTNLGPLNAANLGEIAKQWLALGGAGGPLGAALTGEQTGTDGISKYVHFANGDVTWSPDTGTQVVQGLLSKAWDQLGGATGSLGLPTGGQTTSTVDGQQVLTQVFQFGQLVLNTVTGAVTKVVTTYTDTYNQQMSQPAAPAAVPTAPAAAPASP